VPGVNLKSGSCLGVLTLLACRTLSAAAENCESLAHAKLPTATVITLAQSVAAEAFTPPVPEWGRAFMQPKAVPTAFCRVTGEIRPVADSHIKFEVWLPASGWSGRYESVGNGGFAGSIRYDSMVNPLLGGSVVASTDDGHDGPAIGPTSADWALGHPQRVIDYGHRAVHLTAVTAKALTAAFYGRKPAHSYFVGCSKGGQEGMMEAQRYPADFDGIVSGAAANQWTELFSSFVWAESLNLKDKESYLTVDDLARIGKAVTAACAAPGDAEHGFISDPLKCSVPAATLGLSAAKLRTYQAIHDGPKDHAGRTTYPGLAIGSEAVGWKDTVTATSFEAAQTDAQMSMYGGNFFRNFVYQDRNWSFQGFDLDKGRADAVRVVGKVINADETGLRGFQARGGKLIQYVGLVDSIVTPLSSVRYYQSVLAAQGSASDPATLTKMQSFYRLFLAPGVGHCAGGPGPNQFGQAGGNGDAEHDMVVALENWVEKDVAPVKIVATKFIGDDKGRGTAMTRPLCPYPQVARYTGSGAVTEAANFSCVAE
jgi:hypothetical protein